MFCSVLASGIREATPCRSPVPEWQAVHFAAKNTWPAVASPTSTFGGGASVGGGEPCRPAATPQDSVPGRRKQAVQKYRHGLPVSGIDRHRRHALVGPPALDHGNDQLAVLIGQHELRAKKVRPAQLTSARVHAMASAAGNRIERPAALDHGGIARRSLLLREDSLAAALSSATGGGSGRSR